MNLNIMLGKGVDKVYTLCLGHKEVWGKGIEGVLRMILKDIFNKIFLKWNFFLSLPSYGMYSIPFLVFRCYIKYNDRENKEGGSECELLY